MPIKLPVAVNPKDWQSGAPDAPLTLVEYGDFQCPDALNAYLILKPLRAEYGDQVRFVYRHLPLTDVHVYALDAAKAAEAAGMQGHFWEMHDALFEAGGALNGAGLRNAAERAGLDIEAFAQAMQSPEAYAGVRDDVDGIRPTGIGETPTLFVNGLHYEGAFTREALAQLFEGATRAG